MNEYEKYLRIKEARLWLQNIVIPGTIAGCIIVAKLKGNERVRNTFKKIPKIRLTIEKDS